MNRKALQAVMVLALVVALAVLFIVKPRGAKKAPVTGASELVIISPHWMGIEEEFGRAFSAWHRQRYGSEVKLVWRDIGQGTSGILRFIEDQYRASPDGIGIDLIFGGGPDPCVRLGDKLVPVKLPEDTMKALRKDFFGNPLYDPDLRWYGVALSGFGIIYNRTLLQTHGLAEPRTWEDLADPKMLRLVASGDPRRSGSNHMCYEIILQAYGWDKGFDTVTRMVANLKLLSDASSGAIDDVALGNSACGLAIDFYAWGKIHEIGADKIGYAMPESLSVITPDPIGVLRGAPHPETAARFVEFVMSVPGQKLWMLPVGAPGGPTRYALDRMAVRPDVYDELGDARTVKVNPYTWKSGFRYDPEKGARRYDILNHLFGATLLNPRKELTEAWEAVIRRGMKPDEVAALCRPPVTEQELDALAARWSDTDLKTRTISEWEHAARGKYRALAK